MLSPGCCAPAACACSSAAPVCKGAPLPALQVITWIAVSIMGLCIVASRKASGSVCWGQPTMHGSAKLVLLPPAVLLLLADCGLHTFPVAALLGGRGGGLLHCAPRLLHHAPPLDHQAARAGGLVRRRRAFACRSRSGVQTHTAAPICWGMLLACLPASCACLSPPGRCATRTA